MDKIKEQIRNDLTPITNLIELIEELNDENTLKLLLNYKNHD